MSEFDKAIPTAFGYEWIGRGSRVRVRRALLVRISDSRGFTRSLGPTTFFHIKKKFFVPMKLQVHANSTSSLDDKDPYAEANADDSGAGAKQRNGRKSLTTVQGLKKVYSYSKLLKDLKKAMELFSRTLS